MDDLPRGWNSLPFEKCSQELSDAWIEDARSLVLRVPSVVNPIEFDYLINPVHPDFGRLKIGSSFPLPLDARFANVTQE